jgi:hypothetical protein
MTLSKIRIASTPHKSILAALIAAAAAAAPAMAVEKAVVFEFEFINSGIGLGEPTEQESERLRMTGERLREHLEESGQFDVIDIAPVAEAAAGSNLQSCGNCADRLAREIGADYAFTGTVQKVSELILNINVYVQDAEASKRVAAGSVDLRGNTDESWRRGIDYLYENVLAPRLEQLSQ